MAVRSQVRGEGLGERVKRALHRTPRALAVHNAPLTRVTPRPCASYCSVLYSYVRERAPGAYVNELASSPTIESASSRSEGLR